MYEFFVRANETVFYIRVSYREKTCDVTLPWYQHFWISTDLSWQRGPFVLLKNGRRVCVSVLILRTIIYRIVLRANFFLFFFACHICRTTVFLDPEILLPWQKDERNLWSHGNFQSSLLSGCLLSGVSTVLDARVSKPRFPTISDKLARFVP